MASVIHSRRVAATLIPSASLRSSKDDVDRTNIPHLTDISSLFFIRPPPPCPATESKRLTTFTSSLFALQPYGQLTLMSLFTVFQCRLHLPGHKKRAVSNSFLIYWQVRVLDRREIGRVFRIPHNLFKSGKNRKQNKKWWAQENGKGCNSWGRTAVTKENNADGRIPLPSGMCGFKSSPSISVFSATSPFVGASPCSDAYTVSPGKIHMNRAAIAVVTVHPLFGWTRCAVAV